MASINDYLRWRGDLSFTERAFNDVDNLVLSMLAYLDFTGIVPGEQDDGDIFLWQACEQLLEKAQGNIAPYVRSMAKIDEAFVELVSDSRRFGDACLSDYVDQFDKERALQFSAVRIELPDEGTYLAFRGTDSSLVGWRENFMLSFTITEAQKEAVHYLERSLARHPVVPGEHVRVGGHSKGGNLAEYAAACCSDEARARLTCVYSNDGPGFAPEVVRTNTDKLLGGRIRRIVPTYSVIGMLFARDDDERAIVNSSATGVEQHDPTTWQTAPDGFQWASHLQPDCVALNRTLAAWIQDVPLDEREQVVGEVFDALQVGGATTFREIIATPERLQQVLAALRETDEHTRPVITALARRALGSSIVAVRGVAKRMLALPSSSS